jgi:dynein heavy chain 1
VTLTGSVQLLAEIKKSRASVDSGEVEQRLGLCVVRYGQAQAKVATKYDAWHRELLGEFAAKLGAAIRGLFVRRRVCVAPSGG